jgi:FkbM family methyltransferase
MKRENLIIDVGMHDGSDTAFYLAKGFDVVAIEAHPDLADAAVRRFDRELASGQLRILPVAIAETDGTLPFGIAEDMSIWSSLSSEFIQRNEKKSGTRYRYVEVQSRRFESVLEEFGVPRYLKIDIEGNDMLCIRALRRFVERPSFVSVESAVSSHGAPFDDVFDELSELWGLGYRGFAYVNQRDHPRRREPMPAREGHRAGTELTMNHTGLFGDELPRRWRSISTTLAQAQLLRLRHNTVGYGGRWSESAIGWRYASVRRRLGGHHSWYDLHARLPSR